MKICRLRSELDIVRGNTKVMSEMLTEMVPGQEDASDYELLQVRNHTFKCVCLSMSTFCSVCVNEHTYRIHILCLNMPLGAEQDL